jgi:hypothetical protein
MADNISQRISEFGPRFFSDGPPQTLHSIMISCSSAEMLDPADHRRPEHGVELVPVIAVRSYR